jgi:hypothetical protein
MDANHPHARLALACQTRMDAIRVKGKTRDKYALEFCQGAQQGLMMAGGNPTDLHMLVWLVAIRGYAEIEQTLEKIVRR